MIKALLIYPEFPVSYWSEKYALEFIGRKAALPPLGLLTLGALFPPEYKLQLIDMNLTELTDSLLEWADYVFLSAMLVQKQSVQVVIERCNRKQVPVVVGGPYATTCHEQITGVSHFLLGEVDDFFCDFLARLETGTAPFISESPLNNEGNPIRPDITRIPPPRYDLVKVSDYNSLALQFSRGCPYNCEFCDITKLFGRLPRTKTVDQMLAELESIYKTGWHGSIFLVDDNFIGNRRSVSQLLPEITRWQRERGYPFSFFTEATANLAGMPDLMEGMVDAGFDMVFLGLETPNPEALRRVNKQHNLEKNNPNYLLQAVRTIQRHGMEVTAGFIIGLDGEDECSFDAQIEFVQQAGIPTAMVGLLCPLRGTDLYERFKREGRLLHESSGDNVSCVLSYVPQMNSEVLIAGYKRVLNTLYDSSLRNYFERCYALIENWNARSSRRRGIGWAELKAAMKSIKRQLFSKQGPAYLKLLYRVLRHHPRMLGEAMRLAIMGYHYQKVTSQQLLVDDFRRLLDEEVERLKLLAIGWKHGQQHLAGLRSYSRRRLRMIQRRYQAIDRDFRFAVEDAWQDFGAAALTLFARIDLTWEGDA